MNHFGPMLQWSKCRDWCEFLPAAAVASLLLLGSHGQIPIQVQSAQMDTSKMGQRLFLAAVLSLKGDATAVGVVAQKLELRICF